MTFDVLNPRWAEMTPVKVVDDGLAAASRSPHPADAPLALELETSAGRLTLSLHAQGARLRLGPQRTYDYGMLVEEPAPLPLQVEGQAAATLVRSGVLTLRIGHAPLTFTLERDGRPVLSPPTDGHFVREHRLPPVAKLDDGWFVAFDLASDTPVYGLGETWGRLDKRGQLVRSFNEDALGVNAALSYKNAPFAWSPEGWGVFVHTPSPVTHGVGFPQWSQRTYSVLVEDAYLDLFLLAGEDGAALIGDYTALTGRAPVPPPFSLGVILSKAYYRTAEELLETAREVRGRGMPCDTITLDGRAWQDTDTRFAFEWDPARYPDPARVIAELKAMNFRVCVWEYPLVSVNNPLFAEMAAKGWLLKDRRTGEAYQYDWAQEAFGAVLTPLPRSGPGGLHPSGRLRLLARPAQGAVRPRRRHDQGRLRRAGGGRTVSPPTARAAARCTTSTPCSTTAASTKGRGAVRQRRTLPVQPRRLDRLAALPRPVGRRSPGRLGGHDRRHPRRPVLGPDRRALLRHRRGRLLQGPARRRAVRALVPGGGVQRPHALARHRPARALVLCAAGRSRGHGGAEAALPPAALSCTPPWCEASTTGLPVQRPMVLAYPHERAAWAFEGQFMFGPDLLVAPCFRPDGTVEVYLPQGAWRRFPDRGAVRGRPDAPADPEAGRDTRCSRRKGARSLSGRRCSTYRRAGRRVAGRGDMGRVTK